MAGNGMNNVGATIQKLRDHVAEMKKLAIAEAKASTELLVERLMARTPVWEGTTLRNYSVGVGAPRKVNHTAIGTGDPGPTNTMGLGEEPRRSANEAAVRADMASALGGMTELKNIFVTNNAPNWDLVDAGGAPGGPNQQIRNPGGVSKIAMSDARGALKNWRAK